MKQKVLFVCLGNICRSPAGEAVLQAFVDKENLADKVEIDSAGILDYHEGKKADARMRHHASLRGYNITCLSRPVCRDDGKDFDIIIAMDESNRRDLQSILFDDYHHKIFMMNDFSTIHKGESVPDPYYGGEKGFELVLDMLEDANRGLLKEIKSRLAEEE